MNLSTEQANAILKAGKKIRALTNQQDHIFEALSKEINVDKLQLDFVFDAVYNSDDLEVAIKKLQDTPK